MNSIATTQWLRNAPSPARSGEGSSRNPGQSDFTQQFAAAGERLAAPARSHGPLAADNAGKVRPDRPGDEAPTWYGQFGEMTRFVPAEYRSGTYQMPAMPTPPQRPVKDLGALLNRGTAKEAALHAFAEARAQYRQDALSHQTALANLRNTLNANFTSLPADVQQKALAARDAWLQAHPAAAAKAAAV